jgi:hypothetical protein
MAKINIVCRTCGSSQVMRDAWAEWVIETQTWELKTVFDQGHCDDCGGEASLDEVELTDEKYQEIMNG